MNQSIHKIEKQAMKYWIKKLATEFEIAFMEVTKCTKL